MRAILSSPVLVGPFRRFRAVNLPSRSSQNVIVVIYLPQSPPRTQP
jgi:hypothetical protein